MDGLSGTLVCVLIYGPANSYLTCFFMFSYPRHCVDEMMLLIEMDGLFYRFSRGLGTLSGDRVENYPPCEYSMLLGVEDVFHHENKDGWGLDDAHRTVPYSMELFFLHVRAYHYKKPMCTVIGATFF